MRGIHLALAVACISWSAAAAAQTGGNAPRVDVALVLTVDASGSIDAPEFQLQKEGIAGAVSDPEVLSTIRSGRNGRIAIAYVEWGAPGGAQMMVDWILVEDAASAAAFGDAVLQAPRSIQSYNAIGDAIDLAVKLFEACPCQPTRRIIDVSGDNPDNRSHRPAPLARDAAVADGVTINALAILQDDRLGPGGRPWLVETYERTIIGGFGAFAIAANSRADFARALREKMVRRSPTAARRRWRIWRRGRAEPIKSWCNRRMTFRSIDRRGSAPAHCGRGFTQNDKKHHRDYILAGDMMVSAAAVEAKGVTKIFGAGPDSVRALDGVSVTIRENEFFTLLGPSGCGKTTLLRLIAGFDFPTEGEILLYGQDIAPLPPFKRPVNTVFQNYSLFPHMTVGQNIGFGLEMLRRSKSEVDARVTEMLRLVRMEELRNRKTSQISGGQQQRVALARALAPQPKVLLLDEPLSALDYKLRKDMQIELKRLQNETGITFIFVTHDQEEALTMSDRIAVMSKGHILQVGTPREIYDHPAERFVANFIGETNFLQGEMAGAGGGKANVRLSCGGAAIAATLPEGFSPKDKVTVVVRPEHAQIVANGARATLNGTLDNVVYFGTDTHFHVRLEDGSEFIVRQQNSRANPHTFAQGDRAGIVIDDSSAQVLRD